MHCRQRFRRALIAERMYNLAAPVPDLTSSPDRNAFCTHRRARRRDRLVNVGVAAAAAGCGAAKGWHRDDRAASGQPKQAAMAMQPAGQDPEARLAPGTGTLPLCSRTNASPFWIILLLVWGKLEHGMIPAVALA